MISGFLLELLSFVVTTLAPRRRNCICRCSVMLSESFRKLCLRPVTNSFADTVARTYVDAGTMLNSKCEPYSDQTHTDFT